MSLDPQVEEFYRNKHYGPMFGKYDIKTIRAAVDLTYNARTCLVPLPEVKNLSIESDGEQLPVRLYYPIEKEKISSEGLPIMIYFHGGAYVMHNIDSHDNLCRKLAKECNCMVLSTGYRLAPEYRHPAQIVDAVSVLKWVIKNSKDIGANLEKIITAGDSAGATIAVGLGVYAKRHDIKIDLQVLYYGFFGCSKVNETESFKLYSDGNYAVSADMMDVSGGFVRPLEVVTEDNSADSLSSLKYLEPGSFEIEELVMNTKSLIVVAEYDPLRDDGLTFADKMIKAGNDVKLIKMSGMVHGFMMLWHKFDRCSEVFEATKEAITRI